MYLFVFFILRSDFKILLYNVFTIVIRGFSTFAEGREPPNPEARLYQQFNCYVSPAPWIFLPPHTLSLPLLFCCFS